MSYPLPPDTRIVGSGNPPADIDQIIDALTGMGQPGYIKPSGDISGATDTAAVAAAEAAGKTVFFGPATYWGNFTKQSLVNWQGSGRGQTILMAPAASNLPVLTAAGFAAATGTGSATAGIYSFAIRDIAFDGNKANQSVPAAFGVGIYGADYLLENVSVRNCLANDGLYTEWSTSSSAGSAPDKSMESMYRFLRVHDSTITGSGWHDRGPHDSSILGCWIYNNAGGYGYWAEQQGTPTATGLSGTAVSSTPSTITVTTTLGLNSPAGWVTMPSAGGTVTISYTGTTATTLTGCATAGGSGNYSSNQMTGPAFSAVAAQIYGMHVWGSSTTIGIVIDTPQMFNGCEAEDASVGQVLVRTNNAQWHGGRLFNPGANAYGFQFGDTANQCSAFILNMPQLISFTGGVASKAAINWANEAVGSYRALVSVGSTNQALYGNLLPNTTSKIVFTGTGVTPSVVAGGQAGGSPPAPTLGNATDRRGTVSIGTGTAPSIGNMAVITFAQPKPYTPAITLCPMNTATAGFEPHLTAVSTTGFTIGFAVAPLASQATGVYQVGYADVTG